MLLSHSDLSWYLAARTIYYLHDSWLSVWWSVTVTEQKLFEWHSHSLPIKFTVNKKELGRFVSSKELITHALYQISRSGGIGLQ